MAGNAYIQTTRKCLFIGGASLKDNPSIRSNQENGDSSVLDALLVRIVFPNLPDYSVLIIDDVQHFLLRFGFSITCLLGKQDRPKPILPWFFLPTVSVPRELIFSSVNSLIIQV